jgi:hypothetical protein
VYEIQSIQSSTLTGVPPVLLGCAVGVQSAESADQLLEQHLSAARRATRTFFALELRPKEGERELGRPSVGGCVDLPDEWPVEAADIEKGGC